MTAQTMAPRQTPARQPVPAVMWGGLVLTVVALVYPFIDRGTTHVLSEHIRAGYPSYSAARIDQAVTSYLVISSIVGGLGVLGWLSTMWAARTGKRWAPLVASVVFLVALCLALAGLTVKDTSGDVGLAPLMAWLLFLPCLPGLAAVVQLWKRPR